MQGNDDFQSEMDFLESMYGSYCENDSIIVDYHENVTCGIGATVRVNLGLDRVQITFAFDIPIEFPNQKSFMKPVIIKSRGLMDSDEKDIVRKILERDQEDWESTERHSLLGLVMLAHDILNDLNENGGTCAICLCHIENNENYYRADCWHLFHNDCLVAWWNQVREKRMSQGTQYEKDDVQHRQQLSGILSRIDEVNKKTEFFMERMDETTIQISLWNAALDNTAPEKFWIRFQDQITQDMPEPKKAMIIKKQLDQFSADMKTMTRDVEALAKKRTGLEQERSEKLEQFESYRDVENKRGIECPLCRQSIEWTDTIGKLLETGSFIVPPSWDVLETK